MINKNDFLSLLDYSVETVSHIVQLAQDYARKPESYKGALKESSVGILFTGPSTRTRTAFHTSAARLGAHVIAYGKEELQLSTGETYTDTGNVLSQFLDALVIRTNGPLDVMRTLALSDSMSVLNAMSSCEHPSQVVGDMVALGEARGTLKGSHILYIGDGNNTASALAYMCASLQDMKLTLMCPSGYGLPASVIENARERASTVGSSIVTTNDVNDIPEQVDVVYATRWETMGVQRSDDGWREKFLSFRVDKPLMSRIQKKSSKDIFVMHDLPAVRGLDISSEVLDGPSSISLRQAFHKGTGAAAALLFSQGK